MENPNLKKGQYNPQRSIIISALLFTLLMAGMVVLKVTMDWPKENSENLVLIYILVLSILPVALYLLNFFSEKGGSIEYKGIKLNFPQVTANYAAGFKVAGNIGVSGQAVSDSSSTQILDALKKATTCDIIVIDLENGKSWWETRLLVLLAGAVRHQKPAKVVFTGTEGTTEDVFLGWSHPSELLPFLLESHPSYPLIYHKVLAAAQQWSLVEPTGPNTHPIQMPFMQSTASWYPRMAIDQSTGLPNPFFAEQLLASMLGDEIERNEPPREISIVRLHDLFPILRKDAIDKSWDAQKQKEVFFDTTDEYLAITEKRAFRTLVSRVSLINETVKDLIQ